MHLPVPELRQSDAIRLYKTKAELTVRNNRARSRNGGWQRRDGRERQGWFRGYRRKLLVAIGDAALGQVVRRHFQRHSVASQHTNTVPPQLTRQVSKNYAFFVLIQLYAEQAARKFLQHLACNFNTILSAHRPPKYPCVQTVVRC
jgi:hypothetical protein